MQDNRSILIDDASNGRPEARWQPLTIEAYEFLLSMEDYAKTLAVPPDGAGVSTYVRA